MKKITSCAVVSMAIGVLVAGCTSDTSTDTEGGAGSTATGGSGGSGTGGTSGGSATGGSGGATDAGSEAAPMSACEVCAYAKCKMEADACEADKNGCGAAVDEFYSCLTMGGDLADCGTTFASGMVDAGASLANDLATCMDACVSTCKAAGG
jgi:hypothetical protein